MSTVPGLYAPDSPMATYLKELPQLKPTLPHGQLVCVSATSNVTTTAALLRLATAIGPYIAVLQIHSDNIGDWSTLSAQRLTNVAQKFGFLLWEGGRTLNTQGRSGRMGGLTEEQITTSVEVARKRYTKGSVGVASWAGLASTWAISSEEHTASANRLIPELRRAAREGVASSKMAVRTEISAGGVAPDSANFPKSDGGQKVVTISETANHEHHDDDTASGSSIPGPLEDDSDMVVNLRKFSAISLTQTITQHEEVSTELSAGNTGGESAVQEYDATSDDTVDGTSATKGPPLYSRGVVLCLPTEYESHAHPAYRNTVVDTALEHGDFVLGFLTDEPWGDLCYRERTEAITWTEKYGTHKEAAKLANERARNEFAKEWTPGNTKCFVAFIPVAHDCVSHTGDDLGEEAAKRPCAQILSSSSDDTQAPDQYARQISELHDLVARAAAVRDATFITKGVVSYKEGGDVLYIPIISMEA